LNRSTNRSTSSRVVIRPSRPSSTHPPSRYRRYVSSRR
jgi:hypothetical protein